mmetsp:Transcript_45017/g.127098  ORF Transcript_45017/g.127098 Transcript_45017/m.127098 type:complete len:93 (+) Transcript_45017:721-999(+)
MTTSWALELGKRGIRINCVAPGTVDTPLVQRNLGALPAERREAFEQNIKNVYPLARMGVPSEVASVVTFLCGPGASWTTGAIIACDGGYTAV